MDIFRWDPPSTAELQWLIAGLIFLLTAVFLIRLLRRYLANRREEDHFDAIIGEKELTEGEEEIIRDLAEKGPYRPQRLLERLPAFDSAAEKAIQEAVRSGDRARTEHLVKALYSLRIKLFPEVLEWDLSKTQTSPETDEIPRGEIDTEKSDGRQDQEPD